MQLKDSCVNCMEKMQEVNLLMHQLHCAKAGKVEPEGLPPCKLSLQFISRELTIKLELGEKLYFHFQKYFAWWTWLGDCRR